MKCDLCHQNEARIFYKQTINGESRQYRLCPDCLRKIRGSQGLNFGEDLLRSEIGAGVGSLPFASVSRLGQMTHAMDTDLFDGILRSLLGTPSRSFDLSPFLRLNVRAGRQNPAGIGLIGGDRETLDGLTSAEHAAEAARREEQEYEKRFEGMKASLVTDGNGEYYLELESESEADAGADAAPGRELSRDRTQVSEQRETTKGAADTRAGLPGEGATAEEQSPLKRALVLLSEDRLEEILSRLPQEKIYELLAEQKKLAVEKEEYERAIQLRDLMKRYCPDKE